MKKVAVSLAVAGLVSSLSASNINVQDQEFLFADSSVNAVALNGVEMVQTQGQVLEILAPVIGLTNVLPLDNLLGGQLPLVGTLTWALGNPQVLPQLLTALPGMGLNMLNLLLSGYFLNVLPLGGDLLSGLPLNADLFGILPLNDLLAVLPVNGLGGLGGLLGGDLLGALPLGDLTGLLGGNLLGALPLGALPLGDLTGLLGGDLLAVLPLNDLTGLLGALPVATLLP